MSRFPPMYLNNTENNIVSSILEEEASELKDATFSTQSNIFMNEQQTTKDYQNFTYKSPRTSSAKPQNQSFNADFSPNQMLNMPTQSNQKDYSLNMKYGNISDERSTNSNESSHAEENFKKFDINEIKLEVDNLMSHVRGTSKGEKPSVNDRSSQDLKFNSPTPTIKREYSVQNEFDTSFTRNTSSAHSPFMFQTNSSNQKGNSSTKIQNQFENSDMNSSAAALFSSKWQNYESKNTSFIKSRENAQYSAPHVEFPDFQNQYIQARSPFSRFSKHYFEDIEEEDNNDGPFVLPQAQFPDAPKVLQYKYSRRPDSSKRDLADLDGLRKENFNLKAEILKLEKRLQLEEEENKKLLNSLEKSERIRAEYRQRIEQTNH